MYDRAIDLSLLVPSVTVWNVFDLPLWAWRSYKSYVDRERRKAAERRREQGL